jgi:hypothetical protein
VETQILIGQRLNYITNDEAGTGLAAAAEVGRLIAGLHRSVTGNS